MESRLWLLLEDPVKRIKVYAQATRQPTTQEAVIWLRTLVTNQRGKRLKNGKTYTIMTTV